MAAGNWEDLDYVLAQAQRLATAFRAATPALAVASEAEPDVIRRRLERYTFEEPVAASDVMADVADLLERWSIHVTHPRYFGLFNPTVIPIAAAGDLITAVYNPQLAAWAHGAAPNELERHVIRFLAQTLGLPSGSAGHFTTGGQESNLTAVVLALTRACADFDSRGVVAFERPPVIYLSEEAHHSFEKIAHLTGIGRQAIKRVAVDASLRLDLAALGRALDGDIGAGLDPVMIVGTAGTTSAGAVDPLPGLADLCQQRRIWFHVDAAWGGAAVFSRHRVCLAGIEAADSVTWDAHKWLSVPLGTGMFFCKDPALLARAFRVGDATYVPASPASVTDPYTSTAQWSRRFIGLKLFLALAALGRPGYERLIDHQCDMGERLRAALVAAGWTVVNNTPLPLVCFTHRSLDSADLSRVLAQVTTRGRVWISAVRLPAIGHALRACITSYETAPQDIEALVEELGAAVDETV